MTPLHLPIAPADLSRRIAAHWGGERGVARCAGVDPQEINVFAGLGDGALLVEARYQDWWTTYRGGNMLVPIALRFLLNALEDEGLAVDRESGRVLGWAAVAERVFCGDERCMARHGHDDRLLSIVSLDITDPRRSAHFDAVLSARMARRPPVGVDAKREGAMRRWTAAYGGGGR